MRASAGCSFLWELVDELFLLRFLADDPALPECLGGTVISPWQDALMVREVEHAVKGKQEAHAWLTWHYGGFQSSKVYIIIIMGHL